MALPQLRFKGFTDEWSKRRLDSFLERVSKPVDVVEDQEYVQIGIRSHGKGIFHKEAVTGKELGNKRVFWIVPNALVVNIVFAWERAIAVTSDNENGLIASHRFPMYLPKNNLSNVDFLRYMFITDKGQSYLELASPGGAGRNKTLGQSNFAELKIDLPDVEEQTKIASFLTIVDEKIVQLTRKQALLSQYKQGIMQKLFSQQIRFKADDGSEFQDWSEIQVGSVIDEFRKKVSSRTELEIYSSSRDGLKPQREYFDNRELENNGEYGVLPPNFFTYRHMSDDATFKFNINNLGKEVAISKEYPVFTVNTKINSHFLYYLLNESKDFKKYALEQKKGGTRTRLYLKILCNWVFALPCLEEQTKIANFLSAIDQKIEKVTQQIEETKQWKKGLLQQMFV